MVKNVIKNAMKSVHIVNHVIYLENALIALMNLISDIIVQRFVINALSKNVILTEHV